MADKPWKAFERSVSRQLGTSRALMKGTDIKSDIGDGDFPLIVDCKLRKKWELHKWLHDLRVYALEEGKGREAVLVVRKPPYLKRYAIVEFLWLFQQITTGNAIGLFAILNKDQSKRWPIIPWFKEAEKKAEDANKIAMLTVEDFSGVRYAVVSPNVLASVLRSAGVLPYKSEEDVK